MKRILNKHFVTLLVVFLVIIVATMTFTSFIEDAMHKDKDLKTSLKNSVDN